MFDLRPMKSESLIKQEILAALNSGPTRLFNNPVGMFFTRHGTPVKCGLMEGSSDLIGWTTVTIKPEHVGLKVSIFLSVEVKVESHKTKKDHLQRQQNWINAVNRAGGIAGFANSVEQAKNLLP